MFDDNLGCIFRTLSEAIRGVFMNNSQLYCFGLLNISNL